TRREHDRLARAGDARASLAIMTTAPAVLRITLQIGDARIGRRCVGGTIAAASIDAVTIAAARVVAVAVVAVAVVAVDVRSSARRHAARKEGEPCKREHQSPTIARPFLHFVTTFPNHRQTP